MNFPNELKYTKEHEWVKIDGTVAVVGITEFAQQELGDIVFVELPAVGKQLKASETLCVVESTKAASDVYSPIGGVVKLANQKLDQSPELVNSDPYGDGWMVKLENFSSAEIESLMDAAAYQAFLGDKI